MAYSQQDLLKQSPASAVNVQLRESQRFAQKMQAEEAIKQSEKQLQDYLKTPEGIKQYASETGQVSESTRMETVGAGKGKSFTVQEYPVVTRTYTSPYGTITEPVSSGLATARYDVMSTAYDVQKQQFESDLAKQDMKPVYDIHTGQVTGIEDIKRGMSVPVAQFSSYIDKLNAQQQPQTQLEYPTSQTTVPFAQSQLARDIGTSPNLYFSGTPGIVSPKTQFPSINEFTESTKGYSLLGERGPSVSGTLEFLGNVGGRYTTIPVTISDIPPYKLRGSIAPTIPTISILTPAEISEIKERKKEAVKSAATQTALTAPYIGASLLGGFPAVIGSLAFGVGGAEQLFTPKGKAKITEQISQGVPPALAYGLPAAEIGLGAIGLRQSYMGYQRELLMKGKTFTEIQPYTRSIIKGANTYTDYFGTSKTVGRLSPSGLPFAPQDKFPMFISKTEGEYIPQVGIASGSGQTYVRVFDPLKYKYVNYLSDIYPVGSEINLAKAAYKGNIEKGFYGKSFAGEKSARVRTEYGGIVQEVPPEENIFGKVRGIKSDEQILKSISGPISKTKLGTMEMGINPDIIKSYDIKPNIEIVKKGFVIPKNAATILPEKSLPDIELKGGFDSYGFSSESSSLGKLPKGESGVYGSVANWNIPKYKYVEDLFPASYAYSQLGRVGVLKMPSFANIPLVKFSLNQPTIEKQPVFQIPSQVQPTIPIQSQPQKLVQVQVPKQVQIEIPSLKQPQVTKLVQSTFQIQPQIVTPLQLQPQRLLQRQVQVQFFYRPSPIISFTTLAPPSFDKRTFRPFTQKLPKKSSFTVEFRRRGQFRPIGKATSISSAIGIGKRAARQTLGASFRIRTPEGKPIPLIPSQEFRLGKGQGILVQRATTRLSSMGERTEIAASRRSAGFTVYPKGKTSFGFPVISKQSNQPFPKQKKNTFSSFLGSRSIKYSPLRL